MESFKIVTDTNADLPESYLEEHHIGVMSLSYTLDNITYSKGNELDYKEFYSKMRNGFMPTTSQVNPEEAKRVFEEAMKENKNILCLSFSSGLSGSYNSARIAAQEIMEENPDVTIRVIDSKCASLGEGLFVYKAVALRAEEKNISETADWLESHINNFIHIFTVDDLNHLYRGGRVSKTAAVIGTMINIKPILHVDEEGHLVPISKVRGRKKSLHSLVDYMEEKMGSYRDKNDIVFISHGDTLEDAQFVADSIKEKFGINNFLINHVGPTIGAHSGPGTIALFFLGDER